tara:strand:- start:1116 stop:1640 length:525 start_codon:yes stop_codon:yes gene_type:complete
MQKTAMPKVALTEEEVVNKIPRFYREEERINELRKMNKALPIITETKKKQLKVRVDKINPAEILSKRTRVKTNAPSYNSNKTDVIGQEEAKKVVEAVKSGVPILVPRVVKNKQTNTRSLINTGITSAKQSAPGRTRRAGKRRRKRHKTRKRKRKPKTRRRKKHRRRRKRKTYKK